MKKALLLLLLLCLLADCGAAGDAAPEVAFPAPEGLRVAVASDTHFYPEMAGSGEDASAVQYNMELVDALLWDARQQGAELLLLTGDLVNDGKAHRHELLAEKLRAAEETGLAVYVLPGNHDLGPIRQSEFAAFYEDFGYGEAYSRDSVSLSYSAIHGELMLLMMDTAGYGPMMIDLADAPGGSEAFLREETLRWAERQLQTAQARGLTVLCAGHYNLLPESSRQRGGAFYLENGERFAALLRQYRVPLYLSGHMHLRMAYREQGLTELLTEFLLDYPTGYSMLDITEDTIRYTPRRVDVDGWAAQTGSEDPELLRWSQRQQELLRRSSEDTVALMAGKNPLSRRKQAQASAFFYAVMNAYWDGSLHDRREALKAMPGYEPFFRCAEGYAYGWWLKDLIETAPAELAGFTIAK